MDPAGQYASPYVYCGNNPVLMVDKNGKLAWFIPIIIAGFVNVGIDLAVSQAFGLEYGWKDAFVSFGTGAALSGFSAAAKAGKLGKIGKKLYLAEKGWKGNIARGVGGG